MNYPANFFLKEHHNNNGYVSGGFWKHLCAVYSSESHGIVERLLINAGFKEGESSDFKVEPITQTPPAKD